MTDKKKRYSITALGILLGFSLLTALGLAQTPDPFTSQKVLEELKGIRATLTQITQMLDKGQREQLMLGRLQIDEARMAALEARHIQLSAQEPDLEKEVSSAATMARAEEGAGGLTVPGAPSNSRTLSDQASRKLEENRRARLAVEQELATLRNRIATTEKNIDRDLSPQKREDR